MIMEIRRGTTATVEYKTDLPADTFDILWLTMKQGNVEFTKEKNDVVISKGKISVKFTQEETLSFSIGDVYMQVRGRIGDEAVADKPQVFKVSGILRDGKIELAPTKKIYPGQDLFPNANLYPKSGS